MGWQDRDYNSGGEELKAYYGSPLGFLQFALPIWRSPGLQIRLSFWFLFAALLLVFDNRRLGLPAQYIPIDLGVLLLVCLLHEWGHRIFARMVRGHHWEWVLWPAGGMIAPQSPRTPKAVFVANFGGIAFNLALLGAIAGLYAAFHGGVTAARTSLPFGFGLQIEEWPPLLLHAMGTAATLSVGMILINLFPCFWFDGGHLWQAVLWPFLGQWKAGIITCIVGMVLAVPLFLLFLMGGSFSGMLMWGLVFYDCFSRRRMLIAAGPVTEDEEPSYNYMDTPEPKPRRKHKKRWLNAARRRALADQAQQARIDAILDKVKERGLHSLTWWEKRTLKKATQRQRQQDLAGRL